MFHCIYVCVYICVCVYCSCMCVCVYIHYTACMCVCVYMYGCMCVCVCVLTLHVCVYVYICVGMCVLFHYLYVYMCVFTHIFFVHSSVDGHLGCFHILSIADNAAVNIVVFQSPACVQFFVTHGLRQWNLPVPNPLLKFAQVHVHCIGDAIQLSHPLLFLPPIFLSIRNFPASRLFPSDEQNTGASASASVLPRSIQGWFPLRLTSLISMLSKECSGVFSSTTVGRHQFFGALPSLRFSSHKHVTNGNIRVHISFQVSVFFFFR